MEKFSVKKPFTILVAVIMVLLLGFVSITNLQTNLLPDISTPYLMVVTVYPGASPERVESEVSDVMENALGTVSGVENITATSAENYSLLLMKFAEGTDMNSAMVKTSNKVDQTASSLPGTCLTPSIIEYSLNMNAFMTVAVSREGSDVYDLSDFVDNTLVPYVGRTSGVSSVSANGLIEKMVQVQLNQDKIDEVNGRLLELIDTQLADARAQLDAAGAQIAEGRAEYEKQLKNFGNTVSDTVMAQMGTEVADAVTVVRDQAQALLNSVNQLIGVVNEPEILLLDEPLGALDLKLRKEMQHELKKIQKEVGITFIFVTHDQEEAMAISDRIAVMKDGVIQHVGTPRDIYQRPKNVFVATFIGRTNIVNAHVKDGIITFADGYHEHIDALDKAAEQDVRCSIRPEEFIICKDGTDGIHGTVQECTYLGLNTHYTIDTDQGDSVEIVEESSIGEGLKKGEKVLLKVKKEKINVFTKDGGTNLIRSDAYEKQ